MLTMTLTSDLKESIGPPISRFDVGVVGLGYVGLTLATVLAEAGNKVIGVEKRSEVVEQTNAGIPHFSETGLPETLSRVVGSGGLVAAERLGPETFCDTYIITVGTPLSSTGFVRTDMIEAASREVAANMHDGALVIVRSTVMVGATRDVVSPYPRRLGKAL